MCDQSCFTTKKNAEIFGVFSYILRPLHLPTLFEMCFLHLYSCICNLFHAIPNPKHYGKITHTKCSMHPSLVIF